jgi:hypothetical protein
LRERIPVGLVGASVFARMLHLLKFSLNYNFSADMKLVPRARLIVPVLDRNSHDMSWA